MAGENAGAGATVMRLMITNHRDTESQRIYFLCVFVSLWPVAA